MSTTNQNLDTQRDALIAADCERIFADKAPGKLGRRPELDKALDYPRAGDQLVVTRLGRLGRSLRHLLNLMADLERREIDLQVIDQGLDTSTPAGKLIFAVIGTGSRENTAISASAAISKMASVNGSIIPYLRRTRH